MRLIDADMLEPDADYDDGDYWAVSIAQIQSAPTIEPQRWIPCSERLPNNDDFVIVTVLDERGDTPYRYSDFGWYFDKAKCWIIDAEERTDVIAWMPLPEPYKGDE